MAKYITTPHDDSQKKENLFKAFKFMKSEGLNLVNFGEVYFELFFLNYLPAPLLSLHLIN